VDSDIPCPSGGNETPLVTPRATNTAARGIQLSGKEGPIMGAPIRSFAVLIDKG
jgi:hypothetical protein